MKLINIAWRGFEKVDKANFTNHKKGKENDEILKPAAAVIFYFHTNRSYQLYIEPQQLFVTMYNRPLSLPGPRTTEQDKNAGSFFYHDGYLGHPRNSLRLPEVPNRVHRNPTTEVARCKKEKGPPYSHDASRDY